MASGNRAITVLLLHSKVHRPAEPGVLRHKSSRGKYASMIQELQDNWKHPQPIWNEFFFTQIDEYTKKRNYYVDELTKYAVYAIS